MGDFYGTGIEIWVGFNILCLKERGLASNPKMDYHVFLCIFQKNSVMATLGLREMGKFLWEGSSDESEPSWLKLKDFQLGS